MCDIGGGDGPTVALRGDLDTLAMDDEKDVTYRSQRPGVAHACGHDVHTTVVLGAGLALAELAAADPAAVPGRIRLVFEPAEEALPSGAIEVLGSAALDGVDAIYGFHCDPKLDVGQIGVRAGALTSATDMVEIDLHGPGGHTARPHLTVDLVAVTARLTVELPALVDDRCAHLGDVLVVFGTLHTGDATNVIPASASLAARSGPRQGGVGRRRRDRPPIGGRPPRGDGSRVGAPPPTGASRRWSTTPSRRTDSRPPQAHPAG